MVLFLNIMRGFENLMLLFKIYQEVSLVLQNSWQQICNPILEKEESVGANGKKEKMSGFKYTINISWKLFTKKSISWKLYSILTVIDDLFIPAKITATFEGGRLTCQEMERGIAIAVDNVYKMFIPFKYYNGQFCQNKITKCDLI